MIKKTHIHFSSYTQSIDTAQLSLTVLIRPHSLLILNVDEEVVAERDMAGILG